jgi:hypothetical protein
MSIVGVVERACQLAREGKAGSEVRRRLSAEGYTHSEIQIHLRGGNLRGTLKRLAAEANNGPL